jgi:hypothetical protein
MKRFSVHQEEWERFLDVKINAVGACEGSETPTAGTYLHELGV